MTTTLTVRDGAGDGTGPLPLPAPAPVAWRAVGAIAGVLAVALTLTSGRYGWFGDELYFLSAGARPAAGYADQPPMLPMLAAAADAVAPGSLSVLRIPATLATVGQVVLAAVIAAELGGRRRAQVLAAGAAAIGLHLLAGGHILATSTIDPFFWASTIWLLVRWTRTRRDVLLLATGGVVAVALTGKVLIPVLLVGIAAGMAVAGPRIVFRRPLLWVGVAVALLSTVPTLWWQATHGWPQLQMGSVVAGEAGLFGNRWQFLPRALWYAGILPGAVLVVAGLWALLRVEALRPWRWLGLAVVVGTLLLLIPGGRPYYVAGFYATLYAAGAVAVQHLADGRGVPRSWGWTLSGVSYGVCGALIAALALPVGPPSARAGFDYQALGQVGWPEFTDGVARAWSARPPERRGRAAVVAYSYWYASALEREGPARGLPETIYSPHRGFGYFGPPPDSASWVLLVGKVRWAPTFCADLHSLPPYISTAERSVTQKVPLAWCRPSAPWSSAWPSLRYMD